MILFILIALLWAKLRHYRCSVIFKEISLIPALVSELVFWYFQIQTWRGNYRFLPYSSYLQTTFILSLLWPILKFGLYRAAFAGCTMVILGSALNRLVMYANGGIMPVWPTVSKWTKYYVPGSLQAANDVRHCLMTSATRLPFLGDYIDVGFSIMSPGDLLIHGFTTVVLYHVIKHLNENT